MSTVSNFIITGHDRWHADCNRTIEAFEAEVAKAGRAAGDGDTGLGRLFRASDAHAEAKHGPRVFEMDVWLAVSNCFSSVDLVELLLALPPNHRARGVVVFACDQEQERYRQVWPVPVDP